MSIYLDWNATSPRHPRVVSAMMEAEHYAWANPSSVHQAGRAARKIQENTREQLARLLGRSPRDVVFTSGGTEANHLALHGAQLLIVSAIEHPSILAHAAWLAERGTQVLFAQVDAAGRVVPSSVEELLEQALGSARPETDRSAGGFNNKNTPLVALMAVNHETGVIQPLAEVSAIARRYGARLHVDAVQWLGKGAPQHLEVADSIAITAHKARGPKGIGALAFDCGWSPLPTGRGGAQERGLRPGTVDAVALAGWGAALSRMDECRAGSGGAALLGRGLAQHLTQWARGDLHIHGADAPRLEHVINFRCEGWKGDELVAALDLEGICVSSGSACSAGTAEPSPVIEAMLGRQAATGAVRISLGEETTEVEVTLLLQALERLGVLHPAAFAPGSPA
jgi:cysteine desulfurase